MLVFQKGGNGFLALGVVLQSFKDKVTTEFRECLRSVINNIACDADVLQCARAPFFIGFSEQEEN